MIAFTSVGEFWDDIAANANAWWLFWIAFAAALDYKAAALVVAVFVMVHLA